MLSSWEAGIYENIQKKKIKNITLEAPRITLEGEEAKRSNIILCKTITMHFEI